MIKKFLSATLFGFLALGFAGTFVACDDYDDSDLRMRVEAVEGTLADLQAQIKDGAVIKSVTPSADGITITMADGTVFNITNGKDGLDGAAGQDGKPGSVVEIGENGNWFIDGVDTGKPSRGAAGQDGADGQDGQDGAPGKDGVTPSIEIVNGTWWINGEDTGISATGPAGQDGTEITISEDGYWVIDGVKTPNMAIGQDGQDGADGQDGQDGQDGADGLDADMVYYFPGEDGYWYKVVCNNDGSIKVEPQKDETVPMWKPEGTITAVYDTDNQVLTLYNVKGGEGEKGIVRISLTEPLTGLQFVPDNMLDGMGVVYKYRLFHNNKVLVESNNIEMVYRLNPSNADTKDVTDWSFVGRKVGIATRADGDMDNLLSVVGTPKPANGEVTVVANVNELPVGYDPKNDGLIFALKAVGKNGRTVISDNATLIAGDMRYFAIFDKTEDPVKELDFTVTANTIVSDQTPVDLVVVRGSELDLNEVAQLRETALDMAVEEAGFDVTYRFSKTGIKDATGTVQDDFITLDGGVITVNEGASAIGRRPVIKIEALVNNTVVATAYAVIRIDNTDVKQLEVTAEPIELEYTDVYNDTYKRFDYTLVNSEIYDVLDLTAAQFAEAFNSTPEVVGVWSVNGTKLPNGADQVPGVTLSLNDWVTDPTGTASFATVAFNPQVPVSTGSQYKHYGKITITYTPKVADSYPTVVLYIPYTVTDNSAVTPEHNSWFSGKYEIVGYATENPAGYNFATVLSTIYKAGSDLAKWNIPAYHSYEFRFADPKAAGLIYKDAELSNAPFNTQEIDFDGEIGDPDVTTVYPMELVSYRANGEFYTVIDEFTVEFVNPLDLSINTGKLTTRYQNGVVNDVDVKSAISIKDTDRNVQIVNNGNVVSGNKYGVSTVNYTFSLVDDLGGAASIDGKGVFSFDGSGWNGIYPAKVTVNITVTVPGIAMWTEQATVTVNKAN